MVNAWQSETLLPYEGLENGKKALEEAKKLEGEKEDFNEVTASPEQYANHAQFIFNSAILKVNEGVSSSNKVLSDSLLQLEKLEESRKLLEKALDEEIRKSLKTEETGTQGDALINYITQKQKRLNGLQDFQRELTKTEEEIKRLKTDREAILKKFRAKCKAVQTARIQVVEMIEKGSASSIKAELVTDCERDKYKKRLEDLIDRHTSTTNKISRKEAQLGQIIENITPDVLIDIIRNNDADKLIRICPEVTPNTAKIVISMDEADVFELEECLLEDKFVISYKRQGEEEFTPVESGLSGGEQALALISVAMVPKPVPLIIDQPEDELGPALITHELVEQIRGVKGKRQLLFVTHVPNIPVLADSEQIIYVKQTIESTAKKSELDCCGSLDNLTIVKHLLELDGGDTAFEKRRLRYSRVINQ